MRNRSNDRSNDRRSRNNNSQWNPKKEWRMVTKDQPPASQSSKKVGKRVIIKDQPPASGSGSAPPAISQPPAYGNPLYNTFDLFLQQQIILRQKSPSENSSWSGTYFTDEGTLKEDSPKLDVTVQHNKPPSSSPTNAPDNASSTLLFGNSSTPDFGSSFSGVKLKPAASEPASGVASDTQQSIPAFGASTTTAFGQSSTPVCGSGSAPGSSTSTAFGAQSSLCGSQTTSPAFGSPGFGQHLEENHALTGGKSKINTDVEPHSMVAKVNRLEQEVENRVSFLESGSRATVDPTEVINQIPSNFTETVSDMVLIVGGHDGSFWLPSLDLYFLSRDIKFSLNPMNSIKSCASAATFNGEVYHFGGNTVESYNTATNQWVRRPDLYWKNTDGAGTSVLDKLFAVGGADGRHCSSEVEYLDVNVGMWLPARSMQNKRLAPAAAELDHVLYVSGGYDGVSSLSSVERLDPRQKHWETMSNMNAKKGCHSMVVLNDKLYTVGGYNGADFLATLEYLDTRMGTWVEAEPMNVAKGSFGAFVLEGKIFTIGGRKGKTEVLDIVECYKEGTWELVYDLKAIGKRSHFSAIVI